MLSENQRDFLDQTAFARLATLMPDGSPQLTVMWYRRVDDTLEMICPEAAQKTRNLDRDGRVSVVVEAPDNPGVYLELRGTAEVIHDDSYARQRFLPIAQRYLGDHAEERVRNLPPEPRVLLVVHIERVRER